MGARAARAIDRATALTTDLQAEAARLRAENAALEAEVERLEGQLAQQELYLLDGYVVAVLPVGGGTFIATCPTLHASVQEPSRARAVAGLREAMAVAKQAHDRLGRELPERDVVGRCLG